MIESLRYLIDFVSSLDGGQDGSYTKAESKERR